jgi:hypothetical protein
MPLYRVLKEKPVPEDKWTADLSSHSKFVATGEVFFAADPANAQPRVEQLQAENGGCYALQAIQKGEKP